jgi:hypothetical protein
LGEDFLVKYWDYEKNEVNPWKISPHANKPKIWIKCQDNYHHESYLITCNNFCNGQRCGYCSGKKVHKYDSLGWLYPEVLDIWSDKNRKAPYEYLPNSGVKVWWKCTHGKHKDYQRRISDAKRYDFRCPECEYSKGETRISEYLIDNKISYVPQKVFKGLTGLKNGLLSYDFYLYDYDLLIEFQGEQHEKYIPGFHENKKVFE